MTSFVQDRPSTSDIPVIELIPLTPVAAPTAELPWYSWPVQRARLFKKRWYLTLVVVPTVVSAIYLLFIAANRYESEARFVVRSPNTSAASQITNLVQGTGIVLSSDDAYIVHEYMKSRDAVRALITDFDLMARLQRPEADLLWQYPGALFRHSLERLWRHFQSFIAIDFDTSTGITTLRVQGFRPDDARLIAEALVERAERLINTMSERAHRDSIRAASEEVERTREQARATLISMREFRRTHELIDPNRTSAVALETITRLALEIAKSNAELAEMRSQAADSPQARSLVQRIAAYEEQIRKERLAMAGADTSLAPLIAEFERLTLEREFAERAFASAQNALDVARVEAERQRLFIERISQPASPDYPKYPYRISWTLAIFALTSILFSIGRRIVTDTRSHASR